MTSKLLLLLGSPEREEYSKALRTKFPELRFIEAENYQDVVHGVDDVDVILTIGWKMHDDLLKHASRLKWIQSVGVGVDGIVNQPSLRTDIVVTNIRGIHAEPVSEAALGLMLSIAREFPRMAENQKNGKWERFQPQLLFGKTVGIFGVGAIGTALARRCACLGMTVVGISTLPRAVEGFTKIFPREELLSAVRDLDYLVLLTPHTAETHHIIAENVFREMKPSSILVNVARGGVVDERALISALLERKIGGAGLDVFAQEPLPHDSILWSLPNVVISPHLGGIHRDFIEWNMRTIGANVQAFSSGNVNRLINVVSH